MLWAPALIPSKAGKASVGIQLVLLPKYWRQFRRIRLFIVNLPLTDCQAPKLFTNSPAGTSLQPAAFCPHHNGEKSPEPCASTAARNGAMALVANGKSGARADIGPSSRITRFTMPRAGPPENRLVIAVCRAVSRFNASR